MPHLVNNQCVPEELIQEEAQRISRDITFQSIQNPAERAKQLRAAAEQRAIERMLIEQAAAKDSRPLDPAAFEHAFQQQRSQFNCRTAMDENQLRRFLEHQFRVLRVRQEMIAGAAKPSADEVGAFYAAQRENFRKPDVFHAAHIVKHVNEQQSEEQAEAGIRAALAELERGEPFSEVAERHSDCKGNGGDLGQFPASHMVDEFEQAIRALEPGQRTGIFTTPFGFHIAELRARMPAELASFEEVREKIEKVFLIRNQHELYLRAAGKLREGADIRFVPERERQRPDVA